MASFTLLVTQSPFDRQHAYSAYRFAKAVFASGHDIKGVFFYQAGVSNANSFQAGNADELNMLDKWKALVESHDVTLQVCVTAANRRGVIDEGDAEDLNLDHFNLMAPFEPAGLGGLIELMDDADRVVQF